MNTVFYFNAEDVATADGAMRAIAYTKEDEASRGCTMILYERTISIVRQTDPRYKMLGLINGNYAGACMMSRVEHKDLPVFGKESKYVMILAPPEVKELYELFVGNMDSKNVGNATYHTKLEEAMFEFSKQIVKDYPHAYIKKHSTDVSEEYYVNLTAKTHSR
jgi:hypothetical protein